MTLCKYCLPDTRGLIKKHMEYTHCPNCKREIVKSGFLKTTNKIVESGNIAFFKRYLDFPADAVCQFCENDAYYNAKLAYNKMIEAKKKEIIDAIDNVPLASIHNPYGWEYEVINIVTAQNVMGTGLITEISTDFIDFFGSNSNRMANKLSNGEKNCLLKMQTNALVLGGNAIIGIDIDYAEVGALKGMLMVCTTGTAVRLKNTNIFNRKIYDGNDINQMKNDIAELEKEYQILSKI